MTHHHAHIVAYYLHMAALTRSIAPAVLPPWFTEQYWLGRAFLYTDFT